MSNKPKKKPKTIKEFLYKYRKGTVFFMGIIMYALLLLVLLFFLAGHNPQIVRLSRTSVVMLFTFIISMYLLTQIYGKYDLGIRKSKPIMISVILSVFFTDIITFAILVIMNTNDTTNNELYPFFFLDLLRVGVAFLWQILIAWLFTYGGHRFYFSFVPPEKCIIITDGGKNLKHIRFAARKYEKQFCDLHSVQYNDPYIEDEIDKCDSVFLNRLDAETTRKLLEICYRKSKRVYRTMGVADVISNSSRVMLLEDESFLASEVKEKNMHQRIVKRIVDIIVSIIGLIITSPLLLIAFIAIKLDDGGPVIFSQNRVTIGGKIFMLYKIRTMSVGADGSLVAEEKDGRITKAGHWLRKFRIDEIPQFVNVLKGDMSVIGPRAEMTDRVYMNIEEIPEYAFRYRMKAGITGYAQIMGKYNTSAIDKLILDLTYIQTFSLWNDTKIFFQTILVVLTPDKSTEAYKEEDTKKLAKDQEKLAAKSKPRKDAKTETEAEQEVKTDN